MDNSVNKILILGGGSAGFIAAATLKAKLPSLKIELIRSPQIGIIGVGEGTTAAVPRHFHSYLGITHEKLYKSARPTWKLGIRFEWGQRPHFNYSFGRQLDGRWPDLPHCHGYYCGDDFLDFDLASFLMDAGTAFPIANNAHRKQHQQAASKAMNIKTFLNNLRNPKWKPHIKPPVAVPSGIPETF